MTKIRITKEFHFEMAHALYGYNGPCKNIHGHSYKLSVCVFGEVIESVTDPKNGMVMDFGDLKKIVHSQIINEFDHALVLNQNSPHREMEINSKYFEKLIFMNFQPTCENMIIEMAKRLKKTLPSHLFLHHLKLYETASSFAEWFAEDN